VRRVLPPGLWASPSSESSSLGGLFLRGRTGLFFLSCNEVTRSTMRIRSLGTGFSSRLPPGHKAISSDQRRTHPFSRDSRSSPEEILSLHLGPLFFSCASGRRHSSDAQSPLLFPSESGLAPVCPERDVSRAVFPPDHHTSPAPIRLFFS